jgi:nitrogen fixation protein FixH
MPAAGPVAANAEDQELSARWIWTAVIVGLLGMQLLLGAVSVVLALSGPGAAVQADYHQRSLDWDEQQARQRASRELGWSVSLSVSADSTLYGERRLELRLIDAHHQPVKNADVKLSLWHHARPAEIQRLTLVPDATQPGTYAATAVIRKSGLWQVELTIDRGSQHFEQTTIETWNVK